VRIPCRHARVGMAQKVLHGPQIACVQVSHCAGRVAKASLEVPDCFRPAFQRYPSICVTFAVAL
jgi:hypothetical protein